MTYLSGANIKAICAEAGLMALREHRMRGTNEDFEKPEESVLYKKQEGTPRSFCLANYNCLQENDRD